VVQPMSKIWFSTMGCQLFGGRIRSGDLEPQDIAFGQANYYFNNFHDGISEMMLLFALMIVNNWMILGRRYLNVEHCGIATSYARFCHDSNLSAVRFRSLCSCS